MVASLVKLTTLADDQTVLRSCAQVLERGGLAVVPMETVYGVLARADNASAIQRLRSLRPSAEAKAFAVHVPSAGRAQEYLGETSDYVRRATRKLWPGPVSLVFALGEERRQAICTEHQVRAEDIFERGQITLRCPAHPAALEVLERCAFPVIGSAPSADAAMVDAFAGALADKVEMILDDGPARLGKPSTIVRLGDGDFEIVRQGVYDRRIIRKMLQTMILFVCSGNTCRSPMAEAIARKALADSLKVPEAELDKAGYTVMSAGASAYAGAPAAEHAMKVVRELGADLSQHRSRALTPHLVQRADVIFVMGRNHLQAVEWIDPTAARKVALLDPQGEIEDPVGGELKLYEATARRIREAIEKRLADGTLLGVEKRS